MASDMDDLMIGLLYYDVEVSFPLACFSFSFLFFVCWGDKSYTFMVEGEKGVERGKCFFAAWLALRFVLAFAGAELLVWQMR